MNRLFHTSKINCNAHFSIRAFSGALTSPSSKALFPASVPVSSFPLPISACKLDLSIFPSSIGARFIHRPVYFETTYEDAKSKIWKESQAAVADLDFTPKYDINEEYSVVKSIIDELSPLEKGVLVRLWGAHMSLGSNNPLVVLNANYTFNMIAAALNGLPFRSECEMPDYPFGTVPIVGTGEGGQLDSAVISVGGVSKISNSGSRNPEYAQGHFGIPLSILQNASIITIKIAQSAKPKVGGKLPSSKNNYYVARARFVLPEMVLESPPPHHNIYSIEDLKDVIDRLKRVNPNLKVSVRVVVTDGIEATSEGIVKCGADMLELCGAGGGTGASTDHDRKEYGLPILNKLRAVHEHLIDKGLRDRIYIYADGMLQTPEDAVRMFVSGADLLGQGTGLLIAQGCAKEDRCHTQLCSFGLQTWIPELMARFSGTPSSLALYFSTFAKGVAMIAEKHNIHRVDDLSGKYSLINDSSLPKKDINSVKHVGNYGPEISVKEDRLIMLLESNQFETMESVSLEKSVPLENRDHSFGARFSYVYNQLPEWQRQSISIDCHGYPGSGFGAYLAKGVTLNLAGSTDACCGEGLEGSVSANTVGDTAIMSALSGSSSYFIDAGNRYFITGKGGDHVVHRMGQSGMNYVFGGRVIILGNPAIDFCDTLFSETDFSEMPVMNRTETLGVGFGAAWRGGEAWIPLKVFESYKSSHFHQDINHLIPLGIDSESVDQFKRMLESHIDIFSGGDFSDLVRWYAPFLSMDHNDLSKHFVRLSPTVQSLMGGR